MSDRATVLLTAAGTAIGVILGGVPSWYFSRRYYLKSGTDLDAALRPLAGNREKTIQALNAIGRVIEQNGRGRLTYDKAGNITGIVITATVHLIESSDSMRAAGTAAQPAQYDRPHEQPPTPEPEGDHA